MRYRHEKTGAIIDVKSEMGGCWIPVKESSEPPKAEHASHPTDGALVRNAAPKDPAEAKKPKPASKNKK